MKPALLLIDLQHDYLSAPGLAPAVEALCARTAHLLSACRAAGIPVVHVWTTIRDDEERMPHWRQTGRRRCVEGTPGHATPESLQPLAGERVVHKRFFSAFGEGSLAGYLQDEGIDTVILAGLHLRACVRTSALDAYQLGLDVRIAVDAVADDDPVHGALTRQYLSARGISFPTVAEIEGWFGSPPAVAAEGAGSISQRLSPVLPEPLDPRAGPIAEAGHASPGYSSELLWRVPLGGEAEVRAAVSLARAAAESWSKTLPRERVELVERLASRVEAERDALAVQIAQETGKPIRQARMEVRYAVGLLRAALPWAPDSEPASRGAGWAAYRRPQGVIAAITPWNNPLAIPLGKLAPALLFGNTVAWKPAIPGAGIAQRVFELLEDCGCPLGAVTLLQGDHTTAERLISDPGIDAVTLTGSSGAGYAAQVLCARRRIPLQAELGGNNGVIVWGDADLEKTARMLAIGAFGSAGQRCTAARRLIVDTACFGTFLEPFVTAVRALKWGDPLDEATEIGPVISPASRQRIEELVDRARAAGAEVLAPHGPRPEAVGTGCYVPPTIVVCGDPVAEIVQEETFGPVAVIQRAGDWDEALALCNGVRQGLVASLFSRSESRQQDFLAKAQAGMLKINAAPEGAAPDAPFCAWKESGVGPPEHGLTDRDFYCRYQTVYQS